jgi:hypothetical protein
MSVPLFLLLSRARTRGPVGASRCSRPAARENAERPSPPQRPAWPGPGGAGHSGLEVGTPGPLDRPGPSRPGPSFQASRGAPGRRRRGRPNGACEVDLRLQVHCQRRVPRDERARGARALELRSLRPLRGWSVAHVRTQTHAGLRSSPRSRSTSVKSSYYDYRSHIAQQSRSPCRGTGNK